MKKTITKEFSFDSAHRLNDDSLTEAQNKNVFGKCFNFPSHGHRYKLFVTVSGRSPLFHGMIINFVDLKQIVNEKVVDVFDHHFINDLECMKGKITTCENMNEVIWKLLEEPLKSHHVILEKLKLYETPTSFHTIERG